MKYGSFKPSVMAVAIVVGGFAAIAAGGDLDPPAGPIGPTMKTLDELDPAIPVYPDFGVKDGPRQPYAITIATPGSYSLATAAVAPAGWTGGGIAISADNVTLNLNGLRVAGVSGSEDGIVVTGIFKNLSIFNGIVTDWGEDGVDASQAINCEIRNLRVCDNAGFGIKAAPGTVSHCWVGSSGTTIGQGIYAQHMTTISNCVVRVVWAPGIGLGSDCTVRNCHITGATTFTGIGYASIEVGSQCRVINNSIAEYIMLSADGILATGIGNHIEGNTFLASPGGTTETGIVVTGTENLIIKNTFNGYTTVQNIGAGNSYGTFLNVAGGGAFVSSEPWANIVH